MTLLAEGAEVLHRVVTRRSLDPRVIFTPAQRADWPHRYPRGWRVGSRVYQQLKRTRQRRYATLYRRFGAFTMHSEKDYCDNLALADDVRDVTGTIVECGTWKGGMIAGIAALLGPERHYYLFDSYEGLPPAGSLDKDLYGQSGREWQAATTHNDRATLEDAQAAMRLAGVPHVTITKGWFADTLPAYAGGPIALLRCDGDWYQSTMDTLTALEPKVTAGGLIVFDDYYYWEGCAKAVHDYLSRTQSSAVIRTSPGGYAYIRKP